MASLFTEGTTNSVEGGRKKKQKVSDVMRLKRLNLFVGRFGGDEDR